MSLSGYVSAFGLQAGRVAAGDPGIFSNQGMDPDPFWGIDCRDSVTTVWHRVGDAESGEGFLTRKLLEEKFHAVTQQARAQLEQRGE